MIRLHSIEAVNFRSLGHVMFEPLADDRLTAIVGTNGSGKSSLVAAMMWALYGSTPDGVNVRDLRRQGTTSADECRVTVIFEHDGQTIAVTRQLKGSKDTTVAGITVDGVETTATSVRAANEWLANRIGLDADGFLAAVLVQQKQVDALVTAPPRERRDLVERLARIDKMGQAAQAARKAALDAQRVLEALPGSDDDVVLAEGRVDQALDTAQGAEKALADAIEAETTASKDFEEIRETATQIAVALEKRKQAEAALATATNAVTVLQAQVPSAEADVDRLTVAARNGGSTAVAAAEAALTAAEKEVSRLRETIDKAKEAKWSLDAVAATASSADNDHAAAVTAAERAARRVTNAEETLHTAEKELSGFRPDLDDLLEAAVERAETLTQEVGAARGEYDRLTAAIKALQDTHDPSCPTCAQPISDLDVLVAGLEGDREAVKARGTGLRSELNSVQDEVSVAREKLASRTSVSERVSRARTDLIEAEEALRLAKADVETTAEAARSAQAKLMAAKAMLTALEKAANEAEEVWEAAQAKVREASEKAHAARAAAEAARELGSAQERLSDLKSRIQTAQDEAAEAEAEVAAIEVPDEAEQARIRQEWTNKQTRFTQSAALVGEKRGELTAATAALTQAREFLDTAERQKNARRAASEDYQRKVATRDALEAFRKDRLNRLAPELAEVSSDLVNRMSGGKYVAVHLDEDFTPTVTDDEGHLRPVSWLSGGEESLVALALRIAIGDVVFGSAGGLLFLDEVLSAMDEQRRDATISAVRELPGRQIVMINHIPEAADIGDLVLRVVPSSDGSLLMPVDMDGENVHLDALDMGDE